MQNVAMDRAGTRSGLPGLLTMLAAALLLAMPASADELVAQNDDLADGGTGFICVCFIANEEAAAWLTSPCTGDLVGVQILWTSLLMNTPPSLEDSIRIYEAGSFPVPGPIMQNGVAPFLDLILEGPVMTDGFLNEFRFLDQNQTAPISAPVTAGQEFVVSLRFFNPNADNLFAASVVADNSGCQVGKNAVLALPGGWFDACALGVSGDWVIRAVIDCGDPEGACCAADGLCTDNLTESECTSTGGVFQGPLTDCNSVNCPVLEGACCLADGSCMDALTDVECAAMGGAFQSPMSTCGSVFCPAPEGACCFMPSGCLDLVEADCTLAGGFWQGAATVCATTNCFPTGACCLADGSCQDDTSPGDCTSLGGTYQGDDTTCATETCPQPLGACCFDNGACLDLTEADCMQVPTNVWLGAGTDCQSSSCTPEGACCFTNGACLELPETDCVDIPGNVWQGAGSTCDPDPCALPCPGDCDNGDGVVDIIDLLALLAAWGSGTGPCDIAPSGGDGVIDITDLLELLGGWGPCP